MDRAAPTDLSQIVPADARIAGPGHEIAAGSASAAERSARPLRPRWPPDKIAVPRDLTRTFAMSAARPGLAASAENSAMASPISVG